MRKRTSWIIGGGMWLLFGALALGVMHHAVWVGAFDHVMAVSMGQPTANNVTVFNLISFVGSPLVTLILTCVLCLYLWIIHDHALSLWVVGVQFGGSAVVEGVKKIVARPRPVHELLPDSGYSFPSGHVFCTTILVLLLLMIFLPKIQDQESQLVTTLLGIIWVTLVATARLYLAQHFASDLLGSLLIAGALWLTVLPMRERVTGWLDKHLPASIVKE